MRLLIAMMKHETNTFSPVPTPLTRFGPLYGDAAVRAYRGTGTGLALISASPAETGWYTNPKSNFNCVFE